MPLPCAARTANRRSRSYTPDHLLRAPMPSYAVSGALPAIQSARLSVVNALRKVA